MKTSILLTLTAILAVGCSNNSQETKVAKKANIYTSVTTNRAFSQTIDLSNNELDEKTIGESFFTFPWVEAPSATTARDGLGPLFSSNSCIGCHPHNGAGYPMYEKGKISRSLVMRLSIPNTKNINNDLIMKNGFIPEPTYGGQLSIDSTSDVPYEGSIHLKYRDINGTYDDGEKYSLRSPSYSIDNLQYGPMAKNVNIAPHIALALVGLGEIEKISNADILAHEDVNDSDGDGISGKANWVYSPETNATELGRYTWKAASASVKHQAANAAENDMSLTNPLYPMENCTDKEQACKEALKGRDTFDLPMKRLDAIAYYLETLRIPRQRVTAKFAEGKQVFETIGCNKCHIETFKTADNHMIHPYSDFLLHDMGKELSDGHSIFKATAREFRTPPLWGVGLYKKVTGHLALLHDGRARNIEEAILWHGGEALPMQEQFKALSKTKRDALVAFVKGI